MDVAIVDFETASDVDIRKTSVYVYAERAATIVRCAAGLWRGELYVWGHGELCDCCVHTPVPARYERLPDGLVFAAHNAEFDAAIAARFGPHPERWIDTMAALARRGSGPRGLDAALRLHVGQQKDAQGQATLKQAQKAETVMNPCMEAHLLRYCIQDVLGLAALAEKLDLLRPEPEDRVWATHFAVNRRGMKIDKAACEQLIAAQERSAVEARRKAGLRPDELSSPKKFLAALAREGVEAPDTKQLTLLGLRGHSERVRDMIDARLSVSKSSIARLEKAISYTSEDGRLRGSHVYAGAITWRWSSRGVQTHNMKRPNKDLIDVDVWGDLDVAVRTVRDSEIADYEAYASLLRGIVVGDPVLSVADLSGIELRMIRWLANCPSLEDLVSGVDLYCRSASTYLGREVKKGDPARMIGKIANLSLQYQAGARSLGMQFDQASIDPTDFGTTAEEVVEGWRDEFPAIAGYATGDVFKGAKIRRGGLWRKCQAAALHAVQHGGTAHAERLRYTMERDTLCCWLPSGRALRYSEAKIELLPRFDGVGEVLTFRHPHGYRAPLYGGKLAQGATQATARDILAEKLVLAEEAGLRPVAHVHDEIVCDSDRLGDLLEIMKAPVAWAEGLVLGAEGAQGHRYLEAK